MIAFANVGNSVSFGIAYPTAGMPSAVKAMLPQTFSGRRGQAVRGAWRAPGVVLQAGENRH
jgi:hypothetical protein